EAHVRFFFSGRSRHTSWPRDWSSDVCSSDLLPLDRFSVSSLVVVGTHATVANIGDTGSSNVAPTTTVSPLDGILARAGSVAVTRSEERRVGKECGARCVGGQGDQSTEAPRGQ